LSWGCECRLVVAIWTRPRQRGVVAALTRSLPPARHPIGFGLADVEGVSLN
jgi:hypothetical protein